MKKKILLLSDDLRMTSGVATMSKEIVLGTLHKYDWVQLGAAISHPEYGKINYRPGENMKLYSNISLACKILGWKPQVEIERGLENSIEYYKTQINY